MSNNTQSNGNIVMYSTDWCSDCFRAKRFFDDYGIDYTEVNIEKVDGAVDQVMQLNGGMRSVPTILFPDGSVLVEPSWRQLADQTGVEL